jgi:MFS family permease
MAAGMGVGSSLYDLHPHLTFLLAGLVAAAGGLTFRFVLPADLSVVEEAGSASVRVWEHPLSMSCAWCQGFLESGLIALLPVYLRSVGYTDQEGGMLLGGAVLAGIGAQVPLAWLADRVGRRAVVYGCLVAGSVALWLMPHCVGALGLGGCLMVAGASGTALYPLGLAVMSERLPTAARARAGAWFLGVNCLASVIGPEISGRAMDQFGRPSLFLIGAGTMTAVLTVWSVQAMLVKPRSGVRLEEEARRAA